MVGQIKIADKSYSRESFFNNTKKFNNPKVEAIALGSLAVIGVVASCVSMVGVSVAVVLAAPAYLVPLSIVALSTILSISIFLSVCTINIVIKEMTKVFANPV